MYNHFEILILKAFQIVICLVKILLESLVYFYEYFETKIVA